MRVLASWVFGSEGQDGSEQALHFERRATSRTARERASPFACHARVALGGNLVLGRFPKPGKSDLGTRLIRGLKQ